jgi:5'-deoxynucleotidase YfbR-like HD superfamily hydrolase
MNTHVPSPLSVGTRVVTAHGEGKIMNLVGPHHREVQLDNGEFHTLKVDYLQALEGTCLADLKTVPGIIVKGEPARKGNYMRTSTGKRYYPMDPRPDEVEIEVIAHHLAMKCRYAGATRVFYSVAEHSVYVTLDSLLRTADVRLAKQCIIHDGSEAYNGDLIRPLKYDAAFSAPFKHVEELNERAICQRFEIPYPFDPRVKESDEAVTAAELRQLLNRAPEDTGSWKNDNLHDDTRVAPFVIAGLTPFEARSLFLALFQKITDGNPPVTVDQVYHFLHRRS